MADTDYIICTLEDKNYKLMHKLVKEIKASKPEIIWGYSIMLYDLCNGKIKLIKKVLKELKKYNHSSKDPTYCKRFYDELKKEYNLNDNVINCFLFNDFSIIKEIKK